MVTKSVESKNCQDDSTHHLAMMIRHNANLRRQDCNGALAHIISEFAQLLQFHIAAYFDNVLPGYPRAYLASSHASQRSCSPIKSICSRFKAKEGHIRGNLMGKWVDFSARTLITLDPTISIDELGLP